MVAIGGIWSTGAGNTGGAGNFILQDVTSGLSRLFISGATGQVGIGTISPTYSLEVNGNFKSSGEGRFMDKVFAGPTKPPLSVAAISAYDQTNQGAFFAQTINSAVYNTAIAIDNSTTRALTVLNTNIAAGGPFTKQEFFTIYGDGSTHMGKNVQIGFTGPAIADLNTSLNINNAGLDGIKFATWNNTAKIFSLNNTNFATSPLTIYGDGRFNISTNLNYNTQKMFSIDNSGQMVSTFAILGSGKTNISINSAISPDALEIIDITNNASTFKASTTGRVQINTSDVDAFVIQDRVSSNVNFKVKNTGTMYAREIYVYPSSTVFPDYVFNSDYKLKDLKEVEVFIKLNKHLPGIPTAEEIAESGLNISELQIKQMEKIEELTLYIIDLKKEIETIKKEIQK